MAFRLEEHEGFTLNRLEIDVHIHHLYCHWITAVVDCSINCGERAAPYLFPIDSGPGCYLLEIRFVHQATSVSQGSQDINSRANFLGDDAPSHPTPGFQPCCMRSCTEQILQVNPARWWRDDELEQ